MFFTLNKGDDHETYFYILSWCGHSGDDLSCRLCIAANSAPSDLIADSMLVAQGIPRLEEEGAECRRNGKGRQRHSEREKEARHAGRYNSR